MSNLEQMAEVARQALTRLAGTPLRLSEPSKRDLTTMLALADGETALRETYALVYLARWLFEAGEKDGCYDVMDVANTATPRLNDQNAASSERLERDKVAIQRQLAVAVAEKRAPKVGARPAAGTMSIGALTSSRPRRLS